MTRAIGFVFWCRQHAPMTNGNELLLSGVTFVRDESCLIGEYDLLYANGEVGALSGRIKFIEQRGDSYMWSFYSSNGDRPRANADFWIVAHDGQRRSCSLQKVFFTPTTQFNAFLNGKENVDVPTSIQGTTGLSVLSRVCSIRMLRPMKEAYYFRTLHVSHERNILKVPSMVRSLRNNDELGVIAPA